jgi:putative endonuclease
LNWLVYIVECADGTLYTGATNNLDRRIKAHNEGKGAKYTRSRLPVRLLVYREGLSKSEALKLEYRVKRQPKRLKVAFLAGDVED